MRQALPDSAVPANRPKTIPAPTGGWNTARSLAGMDTKDAIYLDNFFPRTSDVMLRKGRTLHASLPVSKRIRSLIGYKSPAGTAKIFSAAADGLYDVTSGDATVASTAATSNQWQHINVTTAGGSFLWMCNSTDKCKLYDGATWTDLDTGSTPVLTGITSTDVANVALFKTRIILCKDDSLSFFYLPTNAVGGAATEFLLGAIFRKGGYLMATASWTIDGGNGPDDYFVAITSEGEVAVYQGTDPSSASTFAFKGLFEVAKPIGRRCFVKVGGELCVMTEASLLPLSKAFGAADKQTVAVTAKIDRAYSDYAAAHKTSFGWQPVLFPEASMLLVNVPILEDSGRSILYSYQLVMNTMTGAWCRFLQWDAECFLAFNGKLYCALYNKVYECWSGGSDAGKAIRARGKTAFNALGSLRSKHVKMVQPLVTADAPLSLQLGIDMDYRDSRNTSSQTSAAIDAGEWDSGVWNSAKWGGSSQVIADWSSVSSYPGVVAAMRLRTSTKDVTMTWIAANLQLADGK